MTTTHRLTALGFAAISALSGCSSVVPNATTPSVATSKPSHQEFEQDIKAQVAPLAGKEITALKVLHLSNDIGPWLDTGLALEPGDRITVVLDGKVFLSRTYDLSFDAPMAVWMKVADAGPIFRGVRSTNTVVVNDPGNLKLKLYPGQRWTDSSGKYLGDPAAVNPDAGGGVSVAVIRWRRDVDVAATLQRVAARDAAARWALAEVDRQNKPAKTPPAGWQYLWELGASPVFSESVPVRADGAPARAIALKMHNEVAILQKDAAFELTPNTKLQWRWKADKLPAKTAENALPTHDYMSIAVEFDNGRDLTWLWSHELPVDQSFHCPLPGWDHRETHIVARSGTAELGRWIREEKNVFEQYGKAVGGAAPKRITRIWLIGVSLFQKGEGSGQFGDIVLTDGTNEVRVY